MCNLYSMTRSQDAIRRLFRVDVDRDLLGNLPPLPDASAPIVRLAADGARELTTARWGMPSPQFALAGKKTDRGVTNIRNVASPHWRRWLGVLSRCLVPFTRFSENEALATGGFEPVWFATADRSELAAFAGIWTSWTSTRKLSEGEVTIDVFGFLTTSPNAEVGAIHPKAMPVVLTSAAEWDAWLTEPWSEASTLQRPLADGSLVVVPRGKDGGGGDDVAAEDRGGPPRLI